MPDELGQIWLAYAILIAWAGLAYLWARRVMMTGMTVAERYMYWRGVSHGVFLAAGTSVAAWALACVLSNG